MDGLREAVAELELAADAVEKTDVRTQLDSLAVSLDEMVDAEEDRLTDSDEAFADVDFPGTPPHPDDIGEIEEKLRGLSEETTGDAQRHIDAARRALASYRADQATSDDPDA